MRSHHGVALFVLASQPRVRMGLTKSDCNMQSIFASIDRSLSETLQIGNPLASAARLHAEHADTPREDVFYLSRNLAAFYTGKDRATVSKAARDLETFIGPKGARLYRSTHLIESIFGKR